MEQIQQEALAKYEGLIRRMSSRIMWLHRLGMTSEDAAQELRWALAEYVGRCGVPNEPLAKTILRRMAIRLMRKTNSHKRYAVFVDLDAQEGTTPFVEHSVAEQHLVAEQRHAAAVELMARLERRMGEAEVALLFQRYGVEKSVAELAEQSDMTTKSMSGWLLRAKARARQWLLHCHELREDVCGS